jgi:DeoR family glycerol-3-phosphate regulon repressor
VTDNKTSYANGDAWRRLAAGPGPARRRALRQVISERGFLSVSQIAKEIGVSEMTVRRDFDILEREGAIERAHGGAVVTSHAAQLQAEPSFASRRDIHAEAKAVIARTAAALVGEREIIGLDVGSTVTLLAAELSTRSDLSIVTNNLQAVAALSRQEAATPAVYVLGGSLRPRELSLSGQIACRQLGEYWLNKAFIGVAGIGVAGLYDYSPEEAEVKAAFIERAAEIIVICDSSKFEQRSFVRVCGLDEVDVLVTESMPPKMLMDELDQHNVQVITAGSSPD